MKATGLFAAAVAVAVLAGIAYAADLQSGLQVGAKVGAFDVVKCAGAEGDGVAVSDQLCYRCKYGGRPVVMIFTRKADATMAALVSKLNEQVAANSDKQLKAFINLLGSDRAALEAQAKQFAGQAETSNVPVVVPVEFQNGPENYGLNPQAEVTVILFNQSTVTANHAFAAGQFNEAAVAAILNDVPKLLQ